MGGPQRWWLEWEVGLLVLIVGAIYLTRLADAPLSGEEARRGQVAREMIYRGDWLVPRQQGEPFLSRPPLQNWVIAVVAAIRGQVDEVSIRLPSAVAILLTVLLIYGYCRTFLERLGAFSAAAAFATMGHVFQFGRLGETEALYTLVVSGSLLIWRWADALGKPALWGWCAGYGLAALGMLSKGPQAPTYFLGGVGLFLLLTGRWRVLLQWPHLVGVALFLTIWMAWQIPFYLRVGSENSWRMFSGDVAARFHGATWWVFFRHLLVFPWEVVACMLPWSFFLAIYFRRDFRRAVVGPVGEHLLFLLSASGVAFLTCWLVLGARNRYFAPLYPCIAPLIGLAIQRCCEAAAAAPWANAWKRFVAGIGLAMPPVGAAVLAVTLLGWGPSRGGQPLAFAVVYFLAGVALGVLALWSSGRRQSLHYRLAIVSVAAFLGLSFTGAVLNAYVALKEPVAQRITELKRRLPEGTQLVSLGLVNFNFCYYYGEPIPPISPQAAAAASQPAWTYFCVDRDAIGERLDFPFEKVASISCEPFQTPHPEKIVLIGRRLPTDSARVGGIDRVPR